MPPLRLLFVSSVVSGGSGRSQRQLAQGLIERGHTVRLLVDDEQPASIRRLGERLADASERFGGRGPLRWLEGRPGRRPTRRTIDGLDHLVTPFPQNAFAATVRDLAPDIVVANSIDRFTWRRCRSWCAAAGVPTLLHIREVPALRHLDIEPDPADEVIANAASLAAAAADAGRPCEVVPSLIDTSAVRTETTREHALLVNPVASHGIDLLWAIADAMPDIAFVLQESWELAPEDLAAVERGAAERANVTLRRRMAPGPALYGGARVLLVPHAVDNRPRVVVEAHTNGIPVLAAAQPGLIEAVGAGGETLPMQPDRWVDAIRRIWDDDDHESALIAAAHRESRRPDLDPDTVLDAFEAAARRAIGG